MTRQLWGWLEQGSDPLDGKLLGEQMLRGILGMASPEISPPVAFDKQLLRKSRLGEGALAELQNRFGPEGFSYDPPDRAAASLGQSYPDQLMRRAGIVSDPVDAVVYPANCQDAIDLLVLAQRHGFCVTPCGGATNVTGGFATFTSKPRVAAHMRRMNHLIDVNEIDMTVEAEAGILLPQLEAQLNARGCTLGHFPQSYHGVTLGGALAAHGSGQRSSGYGRVADMLLSATLVTPRGIWKSEALRHSASGPWLGGLIAGSEGMFGLIMSVRLRISKKPVVIDDRGWWLPSFEAGADAARELVHDNAGLSMVRVSDEAETDFLGRFRLAMKGLARPPMLERLTLALKRVPAQGTLVITGFEGGAGRWADVMAQTQSVMRRHSAISLGTRPGESWRKGRYDLPYLRESLLRRRIGVDTYETVVPWSRLAELREAVIKSFESAAAETVPGKTRGVLMCHLSHSYPESACLYFTALFPQSDDPLGQWKSIKVAISQAMADHGGGASHHHGVGSDHAAMAKIEKGDMGLSALRALKRAFDPDHVLVAGMSRLFE